MSQEHTMTNLNDPLAPDGRRIIAKACARAVNLSGSDDGVTCRWCQVTDYAHHEQCPVLTLMHITNLCLCDDTMGQRVLEDFLKLQTPSPHTEDR